MIKEILVVLGGANSSKGELNVISKSRLNHCVDIYEKEKLILCTGGWGEHFNTSDTAHAVLAKKHLIKKGISEDCFLEPAMSNNTVDDAVKIKTIVSKFSAPKLIIITSNYHLRRVQLIFKEILKGYHLNFIGVENNLSKNELRKLIEHENKAIELIVKNGLYY